MYKNTLFLLTTVILIKSTASQQKLLNVDVLYESLCPDSYEFIVEQLYPVWRELSPYVNLNLVPFGKSASYENGLQFICQHGPKECKGNRIQSCALNLIQDQDLQVEYVNCFMKTYRKNKKDENEYGQECARLVGLEFNHLNQCYQTSAGTQLQLLAEQSTHKVQPRFIPTVLYNKVFDQRLQDASIEDFKGVVCDLIRQKHPEACQHSPILRL